MMNTYLPKHTIQKPSKGWKYKFDELSHEELLDNFDKKAIENFTSRVDNSRCKKFTTDEQPSLSNLNPDTLMYSMKDLRKCDEARYEHVSTTEDNNKFDYLLRVYYFS